MNLVTLRKQLDDAIKQGYGHLTLHIMIRDKGHPSGYCPLEIVSSTVNDFGGWVTIFSFDLYKDVAIVKKDKP